MRLVELIGTNGDGGEFAMMTKEVNGMRTRLDSAEDKLESVILFTHRVKWTIGLMATAGGAIAGLAMLLIEHWLGK